MAVSATMTNNYIKPADAIKRSEDSKRSGAVDYTSRGTAIVNSNTELGQNAFLNILVAELSNMDPTQDQDSTAYVTQMAEFASIEQLNNLNTTMQDFAYQQMVGHVGILSELDDNGDNKFGLITQVFKSGTKTYVTLQDVSTGQSGTYDIKKVIGTSDSGYTTANYETALNTHFLSASSLASANEGKGSKAVVVETDKKETPIMDKDGNTTITTTTTTTAKKCIIKGAYLDKEKSKVVVTVAFLDDKGNESKETKDYDYADIAIAGELTDDVMNETVKKYTQTTVTSRDKKTGKIVDNPVEKTETDSESSEKADDKGSDDKSVSEKQEGTDSNVDNATQQAAGDKTSQSQEVKEKDIEKENETLSKIAGM
ncbi:flagellar hook capping FlgD N-terminal domain-containing protein [uncultured Clostridium sp.]|uniref:flagellar hook assembly protein FlgD n=1 Tax=uncultured Clostridium sp. TaxID=59620 RepID=UPI0025F11C04|nr:flagellar hook capping FlgD N-terminal domain-containing protein [uncultured Clostridium sp.]